jgi:hypothetical protein
MLPAWMQNAPDESSAGPASRPSAVKDSHLWAWLRPQAAALGSPYLVSFSGMAEVFGKAPMMPLTAPPDRRRVLRNWATEWAKAGKGEYTLEERVFPFAAVRPLSPVRRPPPPIFFRPYASRAVHPRTRSQNTASNRGVTQLMSRADNLVERGTPLYTHNGLLF